MTGTLQRRFLVLTAAAAAAMLCWKLVPGTAIDRAAFTAVVRGFANPPFFISGNGSRNQPWSLRTFTSTGKADSRQAPVIVSLGDDLEGFFQSSPPSPIDLAVIFSNFQRLGAKNAATAAVLAWDAPDPIGLAALDKTIARFDSLVMAAPLSRGAVPEPMPPAFRMASIPLDTIQGDVSTLPVVNRIPIPGVILGKENTLAGFQTLESEPNSGFTPLIARWDDRAVFAFPLLTALQRLQVPVEDMEIRLGEYLKLGPEGPVVPLDRFGKLPVRLKPASPYAQIPAEALIDGGNDLFPEGSPEPVILTDHQSAAEPATRAFSESLPTVVSAIASDTALAPPQAYSRLGAGAELALLGLLVAVLAASSMLATFARHIAHLAIATVIIAAQLIAAGTAEVWLPAIPALTALLVVILFSLQCHRDPSRLEPVRPATSPKKPRPEVVEPHSIRIEPQPKPSKPATKSPDTRKSPTRRKKRRR